MIYGKVISEELTPCEYCNPDGETDREFDYCHACLGHGFMWSRTVQLNKPIKICSVKLPFGFEP